MSRAIDIIPTSEGYVIPTDSPINENFIYFLDKKEILNLNLALMAVYFIYVNM